jgi:hypothetical protein
MAGKEVRLSKRSLQENKTAKEDSMNKVKKMARCVKVEKPVNEAFKRILYNPIFLGADMYE